MAGAVRQCESIGSMLECLSWLPRANTEDPIRRDGNNSIHKTPSPTSVLICEPYIHYCFSCRFYWQVVFQCPRSSFLRSRYLSHGATCPQSQSPGGLARTPLRNAKSISQPRSVTKATWRAVLAGLIMRALWLPVQQQRIKFSAMKSGIVSKEISIINFEDRPLIEI